MQIDNRCFVKIGLSTNQRPLIVRIFFNDAAICYGLDHVLAIEALLNSVLDSVTLNKIISGPDSLANRFDIHVARLNVS